MTGVLQKYIGQSYLLLEKGLSKLSKFQKLILVTGISILLAILFFSKILLAPGDYIFSTQGDDLKNYYTLETYIHQPVNKDVIHYSSMNYPYQDIVYYSDNTPLLSMPLKWLSLHGVPVPPIPVFNLLVIINFLFASVLCYLLLSRFIVSNTLAIVLSVTLPYFDPQSLRIIEGTENLALSGIILFNLLLLYIIYGRTEKNKSTWPYHLLNYVLIVCASFIHLYYLLILCINTGLILSIYSLLRAKRKEKYLKALVSSLLTPLLAFATTFSIYLLTDEFYSLRNEVAMGYNMEAWKTSFSGFYTSYDYLRMRFVFEARGYINYESHTYLGGFFLYGILIFVVVAWLTGFTFTSFKKYFQQPSAVFILILGAASVVSLLIALGPEYSIQNDEYHFINYLNPFRIVQLFTKRIEHFRCIGRFSWLFFWAVNFGFIYVVDNWLLSRKTIAVCAFYFLAFVAIKDMAATGTEYGNNEFPNKFLEHNMPTEAGELNKYVQANKYDALMPLPFFLVGSEEHAHTIDPINYNYYTFSFQLSSLTRLPLMSSMLSRTPLANNESLFNFYRDAKMDPVLEAKLKGKKIAVLLNNNAYSDPRKPSAINEEGLREAFYNSQTLLQKLNMTPVDTIGDYILYTWQP